MDKLSEYRSMWYFVMFDLPVMTNRDKKNYRLFRNQLIKEGFLQLQYSIYARFFSCMDAAKTYGRRIKALIPDNGQVRLLKITDKQFEKMQVFNGKNIAEPEQKPAQLLLF